MKVDPRYTAPARRTSTPFVQAGLALLVAGTLVTFSFLAFRTGFAEEPRRTIATAEPGHTDRRPVLLPPPGRVAGSSGREQTRTTNDKELVATAASDTNETEEVVLGTRIGRVEDVRGTRYESRANHDETPVQRSPSSAGDDDHDLTDQRKPGKGKHGQSPAKPKKDPRALGHHKHGHHKNGRGHTKHDH